MNNILRAGRSTIRKLSSTVEHNSSEFHKKSWKESWLGDKSTYPLLVAIIFSFTISSGYGIYYLVTSPDAKVLQPKSEFMRKHRDED
jgi:hypothetical protein